MSASQPEPTRITSFGAYLHEAMRRAEYERLESGEWYAHIPGLAGLWATGPSVEDARTDLWDALDGWLFVTNIVSQLPPPMLAGVVFDFKRAE